MAGIHEGPNSPMIGVGNDIWSAWNGSGSVEAFIEAANRSGIMYDSNTMTAIFYAIDAAIDSQY